MTLDTVAIGHRIKELRKKNGLSQAQLAEHLLCTQSDLSKIERGAINVTIDWVVRIATYFGVSVDEMIGGSQRIEGLDGFVKLLSDCSPYERQLMLGAARGVKQALRENQID